jgi:hypothetical protein
VLDYIAKQQKHLQDYGVISPQVAEGTKADKPKTPA